MATKKDLATLQDRIKVMTIVLATQSTLEDLISIYQLESKALELLSPDLMSKEHEKPPMPRALRTLGNRIHACQESCLNALNVERKKVSKGMERDFCTIFDTMNAIKVQHAKSINGNYLVTWAGWIEALNTLLADTVSCWDGCRHIYKTSSRRPAKKVWKELCRNWDILSNEFLTLTEGDIDGSGKTANKLALHIYWEMAEMFHYTTAKPLQYGTLPYASPVPKTYEGFLLSTSNENAIPSIA